MDAVPRIWRDRQIYVAIQVGCRDFQRAFKAVGITLVRR